LRVTRAEFGALVGPPSDITNLDAQIQSLQKLNQNEELTRIRNRGAQRA